MGGKGYHSTVRTATAGSEVLTAGDLLQHRAEGKESERSQRGEGWKGDRRCEVSEIRRPEDREENAADPSGHQSDDDEREQHDRAEEDQVRWLQREATHAASM
jgi:hypothetical protein